MNDWCRHGLCSDALMPAFWPLLSGEWGCGAALRAQRREPFVITAKAVLNRGLVRKFRLTKPCSCVYVRPLAVCKRQPKKAHAYKQLQFSCLYISDS